MPKRVTEILRYFWLHPERTDDLESVVRWRLLEEAIDRNIEEVRDALGWLVAQGFLFEEVVGRSGSVFRFNRKQSSAAERFLGRAERRPAASKRPRARVDKR